MPFLSWKFCDTKKELIKFGLIFAGLFTIIFGLLLPIIRKHPLQFWPFVISGVFIIWPFISTKTFKTFYRLWIKFGHILGLVNTKILLFIIFFIILTPIAAMMKILKYDPLMLKLDSNAKSYRKVSEKLSKERMEVPY